MLIELIAVVAILGVIALLIVPRMSSQRASGNRTSCFNQKAEIELQVKLWKRNNGSYPAANLSNIGADTSYFPVGLPNCPVDGTSYTISTTTGRVTGHTH
jgi:type II secretory pathway pseudopilin PulG